MLRGIEKIMKTDAASLVQNLEEELRTQKIDLRQSVDLGKNDIQKELMNAKETLAHTYPA